MKPEATEGGVGRDMFRTNSLGSCCKDAVGRQCRPAGVGAHQDFPNKMGHPLNPSTGGRGRVRPARDMYGDVSRSVRGLVQWVECWLSTHETPGFMPALRKQAVVRSDCSEQVGDSMRELA